MVSTAGRQHPFNAQAPPFRKGEGRVLVLRRIAHGAFPGRPTVIELVMVIAHKPGGVERSSEMRCLADDFFMTAPNFRSTGRSSTGKENLLRQPQLVKRNLSGKISLFVSKPCVAALATRASLNSVGISGVLARIHR